jgi:hypothetical protein
MEQIEEAIEFIASHVAKGDSVYIHCKGMLSLLFNLWAINKKLIVEISKLERADQPLSLLRRS